MQQPTPVSGRGFLPEKIMETVKERINPLVVGQIQPPCETCPGKDWGFCYDAHYGTCKYFVAKPWRPEYFRLDYLRKGKSFLRKIIERREQLQNHGEGYVPVEYSKETEVIKFHLATINSARQLQQYLFSKEAAIRFIIPTNMKKWHDEFRDLLSAEIN